MRPSRSSPAASSIPCATRSSARSRSRGSVPNVRAARKGGRRYGTAAKWCSRPTVTGNWPGSPTASPPTVSPMARHSRRWRWRRLVPRHRGGGSGRRGRRLAAARQHPRHDGRRRPPAGLRRHRRARQSAALVEDRGAASPAATLRAMPVSTTSAHGPRHDPARAHRQATNDGTTTRSDTTTATTKRQYGCRTTAISTADDDGGSDYA